MAEILGTQTIGNLVIVATDINPNLGTPLGTPAELGSIALAADGSGTFTKTGPLDTDWTEQQIVIPPITGIVDLDFGPATTESGNAKVTIANLLITNANFRSFSFLPLENADHRFDDFTVEDISFAIQNIQDNVSFDIAASAPKNTWGKYQIKYSIVINTQ
jgi:hypothetical protein